MPLRLTYKTFAALMHAVHADLEEQVGRSGRKYFESEGVISDGDVLIHVNVTVSEAPNVVILAGGDLDDDEAGLEA